MNILESLKDLEIQARTENSHYYTASVLRDAIKDIELKDKAITLAIQKLKELNQNIIVDKIERLLNE